MRVAAAAVWSVLVVGIVGCSSDAENRVIVEDGTVPPEATTTSTPPTTSAPDPDLGPPTLTDSSSVTTVGIDEVTFGMTLEDAQVAAGTRLLPLEDGHDPVCYEVEPEEGPDGLTFLIRDGTVERLEVGAGPITTRSGAGIGSTPDDLRRLFGDRIEERPRSDGGLTLLFVPQDESDARYRIIFETTGGEVTSFRAGRLPEADRGCA